MKKFASSLLVCSLTCSLLISGYQASALEHCDWAELLSLAEDTSEDNCSTANLTLNTADLKDIIEKSVDKSVEKSMEKAALKVARDKKAVKNIVDESKKTSKGSALWKIVKFPFSAAWNVVKAAVVLALAVTLPVGGTYALASSSREAIKTDLNNLLNTLKNSNSANKISELANVAYEKLRNFFSQTAEPNTPGTDSGKGQSDEPDAGQSEETVQSEKSSKQLKEEITPHTEEENYTVAPAV